MLQNIFQSIDLTFLLLRRRAEKKLMRFEVSSRESQMFRSRDYNLRWLHEGLIKISLTLASFSGCSNYEQNLTTSVFFKLNFCLDADCAYLNLKIHHDTLE